MTPTPEFDLDKAHHFFAANCFNRTWDFMDKASRTPEDDLAMLLSSMASLWHWTRRKDVTPTNLSIGYWQLSRVYTLLGQAENARMFGQYCLEASRKEGVQPFYLGYAYEALSRAEKVAGDTDQAKTYLTLAREACEKISDDEEKKMLLKDLETL